MNQKKLIRKEKRYFSRIQEDINDLGMRGILVFG
jgi:hypothetical protein